jgi:hypothetical protein
LEGERERKEGTMDGWMNEFMDSLMDRKERREN